MWEPSSFGKCCADKAFESVSIYDHSKPLSYLLASTIFQAVQHAKNIKFKTETIFLQFIFFSV